MNAFLKATAWHYDAFLKDGAGDVWRVWFDHTGQPCMERLIGHEPEYREPLAVLAKRAGALS